MCVSATIGRRGRSRATADAVRPVNVGTRIAPARERLGEVAGGVRHRPADRRVLAPPRAARGGSRCSARPRARCGPCTRPPRPGTRRPPSRPRASPRTCRRGSRSRRRSPRRASARRVDHRLEHLRRRDHRLPALERPEDDPLLEQRHERRADLDAEVAARDHHRVGLARARRRATSTASAFSIFAITCACEPACSISARSSRTSVGRADERERDEVDAELERELEVVDVLRASATGSAAGRRGGSRPCAS